VSAAPAGCTGGAPVLSQSCTPPPPVACVACHGIPPATGQHTFHFSQGYSCNSCHGAGYSINTVNAATHNNGVKNVSIGYDPATRTCAAACHGARTW